MSLLESVPGMGPARTGSAAPPQPADSGGKSRFKWLAAAAVLLIVATIWFAMNVEFDEPVANPAPHTPMDGPIVVANNTSTTAEETVDTGIQQPPEKIQNTGPADVPDINGTWVGQDGTVYLVQQDNDGTFNVESPGYTSGQGRFFSNMPGKFEVEMFGVGRGEFSVSASGDRALGWIISDGQQEFDTLTRVE